MALNDSIRQRMRERRLDAAYENLATELDALSDALSTRLAEFEALLDESLAALPDEVDRTELRTLYVVEISGQRVLMGPRAASLVASRLERFIVDRATDVPVFEEDARDAWGERLRALDQLIGAMQDLGRERADAVQTTLAERFAELSREGPKGRGQVQQGPKGRGQKQQGPKGRGQKQQGPKGRGQKQQGPKGRGQEQQAEQDALAESWSNLEKLAFAGADVATDAAEQMRAVLRNAVHAMVQAYPELHDAAGSYAPKKQPLRIRKFSAPPTVIITRDGAPVTSFAVDDARRVTEPLIDLNELEAETATEEVHRRPAVGEPADETIDLTVDALEPVTQPAFELPSSELPAPAPPVPRPAPLAAADAPHEFREPAFRDVAYWQRVEPGEILLAIGPPTAYIVALTAVTIAYHLGLWGFNPFIEWAGAFPSFCAFSVWIIGMPGFLSWRVAWSGWRPLPLRHVAERDESFIEFDAHAVTLDERRFDFDTSTAVLGRWQGDGRRGWLLSIDDSSGQALLAAAATSARWGEIKAVAHPNEPRGAWRVSEDTLLRIADHLIRD